MAQLKMLFAYTGKTPSGTNYYSNNYSGLCSTYPMVNAYIIANGKNVSASSTSEFNQMISGYSGHDDVSIVRCANTLLGYGKNYYITLPLIESKGDAGNYSAQYTNLKDYIGRVKNALSSAAWSNCKGFYFPNEIVPGTVPGTSPTSNTFVKLMNDIAYVIRHDHQKEFIWAPYFGYNQNFYRINQNNGLIGNRTNIFDMILFQSHYYFDQNEDTTPKENVELCARSAEENCVYNFITVTNKNPQNFVVVGGSNDFGTRIGIDIEIDHRAVEQNNNTFIDAYEKTCAAFGPVLMSTDAPFVFYCGSGETQIKAEKYVKAFYEFGAMPSN